MNKKATQFLIQEHKLILRALDVLDNIAGSVQKNGRVEEPDVENMLEFLRWFADAHHQAKEETILFPALKSAAVSQQRPVEHMMLEHNQERALIEEMEKNLRLSKLPDFVDSASRLSSTLRTHIYKEDLILFEAVDAALTDREDETVVEQLNRFDTPLDKQILSEKLQVLRSLEWKYLRKS
jgi:hemerythrin-like domain-containing protein